MSALAETLSRECAGRQHCDGKVRVPEDLVPEGQDHIACACLCHAGWPNRRPRRP